MSLMVGIDTMTIIRLKVFILRLRCQSMEREFDITGIIRVGTKNTLDSRIGGESLCLTLLRVFINTHHLKHEVIDLYIPSQQFLIVFGFQLLRLFVTQYQDLTLTFLVDIIDKTTIQQFHLVYLRMVGIDTLNCRTDIFLVVADGSRDTVTCPYFVNMIRELARCCIDIPRLQTDIPALLHSLIGLCCLTAKDHHGIREETFTLLQVGIDESITGTQKDDEHEDTPRHSETCERGAQFITPCCLPYFCKYISHNLLVFLDSLDSLVYFISPPLPNGEASWFKFSSICPITPSLICTILFVSLATPLSWVTTTIVIPSS